MLNRKKRKAEIRKDFGKQIEIYGDYIPKRNNMKLNPNEKIGCDVFGKILRRGGMKIHISMKCESLINIKLFLLQFI